MWLKVMPKMKPWANMKFIIMKMMVLLKNLNNFNFANFLMREKLRAFNVFFVRKLYENYWFSRKISGGTVFLYFVFLYGGDSFIMHVKGSYKYTIIVLYHFAFIIY